MSGIAGMVDLTASREVPSSALRQMARALAHRGPDEEGFHEEPGVGLAWRGLRVSGPPGLQGPVTSADGNITAVCDGRFYNLSELEATPRASEAEALVHLWPAHAERLIERLRGQYAFALWD